ncbi:MAG: hypothetical protein ACK5JT_01070 [Hyphomicrobiaceae bacterium]
MPARITPTILGGIALAAFVAFGASSAEALSMKECSAKYKAAQAAGTLNGKKWNDFRKDECGAEAAKPAAAALPANPPAAKTAPAAATAAPKAAAVKPAAKPAAAAAKAAPVGKAVFPKAVDPKYAKETPGKARMHTCLDQYKANKATNANGGMKWIEKGGGYYSVCNKQLKG